VEYREAIKTSPDTTDIRRRLAEIYTLRGSQPQAIEQYKELIKTNNNDPLYHVKLARIYANSGNYRDAFSEYKETIRLDPNHVGARGTSRTNKPHG
jgi:tetratricopeptide (TPR) repeat protein